MIPLPTAAQMRALDEDTIAKLGIPGGVLMESAGRSVITVLHQLHHATRIDLAQAQILIVAGPGNNGGDGMVIARYLHEQGRRSELWVVADRARVRGDALLHLLAAEAAGVKAHFCDGTVTLLGERLASLRPEDLIIDALLGTGLQRSVTGGLAQVVSSINTSRAVTVSVDLPSGLDADRGVPSDATIEPCIVRADYTVTLGFPKLGLVGSPGFLFAGEMFLADIGIPASLCPKHKVSAQLVDASVLAPLAAPRSPLGHKGSHGHLLIIAGSQGKLGAALLSTEAALRTGVGLCTLAVPENALDGSLGSRCPEAMTLPYALTETVLGNQLLPALSGKTALAVGPGLAPVPAIRELLLAVLSHGGQPMVFDAEAINQLVGAEPHLLARARRGAKTVLTPHPGEAARLLGTTSAAVQADRVAAARAIAEKTAAVVVLKGARTLVVEPPGFAQHASEARLAVIPTGNPGMGSGGMGDALTGMIAALLAAGWATFDAACAAAYWHGLAGDLVSARRAPGSIVLGTEVIAVLDEARSLAGRFATSHRPWPVVSLDWTQGRTGCAPKS